jgi:hypothetical protein
VEDILFGPLKKSYPQALGKIRDGAAGIATDYELDDRGGRSSSPGRVKNFHFSMSFRPALGPTQVPFQWVPEVLSSGIKRPGRDAYNSPPASSSWRSA